MKASIPRLAIGAAVLAGAALLAARAVQGGLAPREVVITQRQIQERLDAMAPIKGRKLMAAIELADPTAILVDDADEVELRSSVSIDLPSWGSHAPAPLTGRATLRGSLRYDDQAGAFYLNRPRVIELIVDKAPAKYQPKIQELAQMAAAKYLSTHPVYVLNDGLKQELAKRILRGVKIKNQEMVASLGLF